MLTAPHFIEDEEHARVYNVAPGEGHTPLSVFEDKFSAKLAFPGIFAGHQRPESKDTHRPVFYSEIVKSEIRRSDRRAAKTIDNLFFKTNKLQMKPLLDRTQLAIRKCKQKEKITAAFTHVSQGQKTKMPILLSQITDAAYSDTEPIGSCHIRCYQRTM
jgi:hypothetical protein